MSDIGFYGLASYLLLMLLGSLSLLGIVALSIVSWLRVRKKGEAFTKTPYFPHLTGLGLSFLGVCLAALFLEKGFLFFKDSGGYSPDYLIVPKWMDEHVWVWGVLLILLWPLEVLLFKSKRRS